MHGGTAIGDGCNSNDDDDFEPVSPHPVRRRPDLPRPSLKRPRPLATSLLSPRKSSLTSSATIPPLTSSWSAKKKPLNPILPLAETQSGNVKSSVATSVTASTASTVSTATSSTSSTTPSSSSKGLQRTGSALSLKRAISKNAIPKSADSAPSRQEEPPSISPPVAAVPSPTAPIIINDDSDRIPDSSQELPSHKPPRTPSKRPKKFKSTETVHQQIVSLTDTPDDNFTSDAIVTTVNIPISALKEEERLNRMQRLHDDQEDDSLQLALAISRSMDHLEDGSATTRTSWSMAPLNGRKGKGRRKVTEQEKNETTVLPLAEVQHLIQANVSALLFPEELKRNRATSDEFTKKTPPWPPSRFARTTKADLEISLSQSSETDTGSTKATLWDLSRFNDEHRIDRLDLDSNQTEGGASHSDLNDNQDLQQPQSSSLAMTSRDQYVTRFMAQYLHRDKSNSTADTQPQSNSPVLFGKEDTTISQADPFSFKGNDDKSTFSSPIWSAPRARRISFKDQSKALDRDFAISLQKEITSHLTDMERTIQEAKRVAYHKILQSLKRRPITSRMKSPVPMDLIAADNSNILGLSQELEEEIIKDGYHPSSSPLLRYSKIQNNRLEERAELITDISLENNHQIHDNYSEDDNNNHEDYSAAFLDDDGYRPDFSFELNQVDDSDRKGDDAAGNDDNFQDTIRVASSPPVSLSFIGSHSQKSTGIENTEHASPTDLSRTPGSLGAHLSQLQQTSTSFSSPVQLPPPLDFAKLGYYTTATQSSTPPRPISPPPAALSKSNDHNDPSASPWVTTPKRAGKARRFSFDYEESGRDLNRQGRDPGFESDVRSPMMSDLDDDLDEPPLPRIPSRPRNMFKGKMPVRPELPSFQRRQHGLSLSPSPPATPPTQQLQLPQRSKANPLRGLPLLKRFSVPPVGTSQQHAEAAAGVSTLASLTSATLVSTRIPAPTSGSNIVASGHEKSNNGGVNEDRMSPVLEEAEAMSPILQDEELYPGESNALSQRLNMSISPQTLSNAIAASSTPSRRRGRAKKDDNAAIVAALAIRGDPTPPQTPTKRKKQATLRAEALTAKAAKLVANLKAQGTRPRYETMSLSHLKVLAMTFGLKPSGKPALVEQLNAIFSKLNPDAGEAISEEQRREEAAAEAIATLESRGDYRDLMDDEDDIFELASDIGGGPLTPPDRRNMNSDFPEPLNDDVSMGYDFNQVYEHDQDQNDENHYYYDPWEDEQMDNRADSLSRRSPARSSRKGSPGLTYQLNSDGNMGIGLEETLPVPTAIDIGGSDPVQRLDVESVILSDTEPMEILDDEDDNLSLFSERSFSQGGSELDLMTDEEAEDEENEDDDKDAEDGEEQDDPADQELDLATVAGLEDLERQLGEFLRSTAHLRQQYLTYKPLDLESLWEECQGANIQCTRAQIRQFLDKQGIICFAPAHSLLSSWRKKRAGKANKRRKRTAK